MSKEKSRELRALERYYFNLSHNDYYLSGQAVQDRELIAEALKDYEKCSEDYARLEQELLDTHSLYLKKCEALELIKKKRVNVLSLFATSDVNTYNYRNRVCELTQKEYDFLREVLE